MRRVWSWCWRLLNPSASASFLELRGWRILLDPPLPRCAAGSQTREGNAPDRADSRERGQMPAICCSLHCAAQTPESRGRVRVRNADASLAACTLQHSDQRCALWRPGRHETSDGGGLTAGELRGCPRHPAHASPLLQSGRLERGALYTAQCGERGHTASLCSTGADEEPTTRRHRAGTAHAERGRHGRQRGSAGCEPGSRSSRAHRIDTSAALPPSPPSSFAPPQSSRCRPCTRASLPT